MIGRALANGRPPSTTRAPAARPVAIAQEDGRFRTPGRTLAASIPSRDGIALPPSSAWRTQRHPLLVPGPTPSPEARCRPLKLPAARHTFASLALAAGRSSRWIADPLGHVDPALTRRAYARALPVDEQDLALVDFGGPVRPYAAPGMQSAPEEERAAT